MTAICGKIKQWLWINVYRNSFYNQDFFNIRHQAVVMTIMTLPKEEGKAWLVVIRLKVKDRSAVADDLRKAGLQMSYAC